MCTEAGHEFRPFASSSGSEGRVSIELCNNCLAVKVIHRFDKDENGWFDEPEYMYTVVEPRSQEA
jgi:hypothetical protein